MPPLQATGEEIFGAQRVVGLEGRAVSVEPLTCLGMARSIAFGATSVNTALSQGCRRISITARGADARIEVGSTAQTASATSHYIGSGERLDIAVPASPNIAVIRAGASGGTLELSELLS